jgi:site-specific DNA recombinase
LLANQIYRSKLVHKGEYFDGEHEAIVSEELWNEVQDVLAMRAQGHSRRLKAKHPSLLAGRLIDGEGRAMTSNHATKPGVRYRYYNTRSDLLDGTPAWRVSAHDLERLVCTRLAELLVDQHALCSLVGESAEDAQLVQKVFAAGDVMAAQLRSGSHATRAPIIEAAVESVLLRDDGVDIALSTQGLLGALGVETEDSTTGPPFLICCPAAKVRRGHQLRLVIPAPTPPTLPVARDEKLVGLVAEAHAAGQLLKNNPTQSIAEIAKGEGRCRTRLTQLAALSCLAPDIVTAIVEGRQPPSLTARSLLEIELPLAWRDQRTSLGFS